MKTNKQTIVFIFLLTVQLSFSQNEICTTFESGSLDGWTTQFATATIDSPALDGTNYLRVRDGSGGSWAYNSSSYPSNWDQFIDNCLCFDYKIYNDGHTSSTSVLNPRIVIYNGATPQSSTLLASFVGSASITENDPWIHVCAPILPSNGTSLPSNGDGSWVGVTPAQWNTLLSNVGGVAFTVDIAGSSAQTEIIGVDNICIQNCNSVPPPTDDGAYCCEGDNLVANGNFEFGNTGFISSYSNNPAVFPGEYDVTNSAAAFGATVTDHSFCANPVLYPTNDDFMVVNGKTQQSGGNTIWEQTISGLQIDGRYKFCANFKNMPQCTFDVVPNVNIGVVGIGASGFTTISANPADPCDWINKEFNFTAFSSSVTLRIVLDETGNGDGNDLAIDDISLTQLIDPELSITVQHQGNPQQITGSLNTISTSDDTLHGTDCEYYWYVAQVVSYPPIVVSGPSFASGNAAGNSIGSSPWNLTTTFPDYTFNQNTLYVVGMYTPECECYDEGFTYQMTYNNRPVNQQMTEQQKQLIIYWILNGYQTSSEAVPVLENREMQKVYIYPNPAAENVHIALQNDLIKEIKVFSATGQLMLQKNYTAQNVEEFMDISNLSSGIYFVEIYGITDRPYNGKFLKE